MPCHEVRVRYDKWILTNKTPMPLKASEPLVKAAKARAQQRGIKIKGTQVKAVMLSKKTIRLKIEGEREFNFRTRSYETQTTNFDVPIDDIHDMAVKFIPLDLKDPKNFFAALELLHHPKAPRDLSDKSLPLDPADDPKMAFRWRRVEVVDSEGVMHIMFEKEFYERQMPPPPPPKPKKKVVTRKIEISEEVRPVERVLEEAIEE